MVRQQIPVSLDPELIQELNKLVSSGEFRSRSHAAEFLIVKGLKGTRK